MKPVWCCGHWRRSSAWKPQPLDYAKSDIKNIACLQPRSRLWGWILKFKPIQSYYLMLIIICKTSAPAVFPSWMSSFSSSSSPREHGSVHGTSLAAPFAGWHESPKWGITGRGMRCGSGIRFLSQVSDYILTGVWHKTLSEPGFNLGMPPLEHPWVGNSEMDPSGWCLDVALNFISAPDVQPMWHLSHELQK